MTNADRRAAGTETTSFSHGPLTARVVFGAGSIDRIADEIDRLRATRVVIIASGRDASLVERFEQLLGARFVGRIDEVVQHVPADVAERGREFATSRDADCLVAVGGGSAIGLAKALRVEVEAALVAVPTTYSGSEMTPIWGLTAGGTKRTGTDERVRPDVVIYDSDLTLDLPARVAGPSGMNALAHCVEAMYGPGASPLVSLIALEGFRSLLVGLPAICGPDDSPSYRATTLYGAYLGGVALASAGTALHHKTCHVLGGMFDLDHGGMNSVVLPHAVAYNATAIPAVIRSLSDVMSVSPDGVPAALQDLVRSIGAPTNLSELGMPEDGIEPAAHHIVEAANANPRPPDVASITDMLERAFVGAPPR